MECLPTVTCSPESEVLVSQPREQVEYRQLSLWNWIETPRQSSKTTSQAFQSTETSELTTPGEESSISSQQGSPAREQVKREAEQGLSTQNQPCGEKPSESSLNADQDSSLWNNLKELSETDFEQFLEQSEWQDILSSLSLSRQQSLARDTKGEEYSSFPTLTANKPTTNSRPAGQNRCEIWWKQQGLVPPGQKLSPQTMVSIQGFPATWLDPLSQPIVQGDLGLGIWRGAL